MKKLLHGATISWSLILIMEIIALYLIDYLVKPQSDLVILFNINIVGLLLLAVIVIAIESYQIAFTFAKIKQRFNYQARVETIMDGAVYGMILLVTLNVISFAIMAFDPPVMLAAVLLLICGILAQPAALVLTFGRKSSRRAA